MAWATIKTMSDSVYSEINFHITWHTRIESAFNQTRHRNKTLSIPKTQNYRNAGGLFSRCRRHRRPHSSRRQPSAVAENERMDWTTERREFVWGKSHIESQITTMAARLRHRQFRHERFAMGDKLHFESKGTPQKRDDARAIGKDNEWWRRKLKPKKRTLKRPEDFSRIADHAINDVANRREARKDGWSRLKIKIA